MKRLEDRASLVRHRLGHQSRGSAAKALCATSSWSAATGPARGSRPWTGTPRDRLPARRAWAPRSGPGAAGRRRGCCRTRRRSAADTQHSLHLRLHPGLLGTSRTTASSMVSSGSMKPPGPASCRGRGATRGARRAGVRPAPRPRRPRCCSPCCSVPVWPCRPFRSGCSHPRRRRRALGRNASRQVMVSLRALPASAWGGNRHQSGSRAPEGRGHASVHAAAIGNHDPAML